MILRQGLGKVATDDVLQQIEADAAAAQEAAKAAKEAAVLMDKKLQEAFGDEGCVIKKNAGPDGTLFGSVTKTELAAAILAKAGIEISVRDIKPPDLKQVGTATADIALHKDVTSKLKVVVKPSGSVLQ